MVQQIELLDALLFTFSYKLILYDILELFKSGDRITFQIEN